MNRAPLLYLDTSALIRLYSAESGREQVLNEQERAGGVVAHQITYVELRAALAGRRRRKLLRKGEYERALAAFEADWPTFAHVGINEVLLGRAAALAEIHGLRAYDSVHLAAALSIAALGIRFVTFDRQLQSVAALELPDAVVEVVQ